MTLPAKLSPLTQALLAVAGGAAALALQDLRGQDLRRPKAPEPELTTPTIRTEVDTTPQALTNVGPYIIESTLGSVTIRSTKGNARVVLDPEGRVEVVGGETTVTAGGALKLSATTDLDLQAGGAIRLTSDRLQVKCSDQVRLDAQDGCSFTLNNDLTINARRFTADFQQNALLKAHTTLLRGTDSITVRGNGQATLDGSSKTSILGGVVDLDASVSMDLSSKTLLKLTGKTLVDVDGGLIHLN